MPAEMDRAAWLISGDLPGYMIPGIEKDPEALLRLANARMPSGRYKGELLLDLPVEYVHWFANRSRAGTVVDQQLAMIYTMRYNGLEQVLRVLVEQRESSERDDDPGGGTSPGDNLPAGDLGWLLELMDLE